MNFYIAIYLYAAALVTANLSVAAFGPVVAPINAFFLIGLDFALRDWLHTRLSPVRMGLLIGATGLLTLMLNPAAGDIALASAAAFTASALADWCVFAKMRGSWLRRSNTSNAVGAVIDSAVFFTLAFGFAWTPVVTMAAVKIAGAALWAWLLSRRATL